MRVVKTSFEREQKEKDEAFLNLLPIERLDKARQVRQRMRKPGVDYSYAGKEVRVRKNHEGI